MLNVVVSKGLSEKVIFEQNDIEGHVAIWRKEGPSGKKEQSAQRLRGGDVSGACRGQQGA